jgi:histone H3/H4
MKIIPNRTTEKLPMATMGMVLPSTFDNALLDQIDQLVDGPWTDCFAAAAAGTNQGVEYGVAALPSSISGSFRQLAPGVNQVSGADVRSRARRAPVQPASVPEPLREQDRLLPMANVARLMANVLPKDAKISKDTKVMMQELVSEFICFITAEANDNCIAENRNAVSQEDLESAFDTLGEFASFSHRLIPPGCARSLHA